MNDLDIFMNAPDGGDPEDLARYIEEKCGDDGELRARVEALFAAHKDVGADFLAGDPQGHLELLHDATTVPSLAGGLRSLGVVPGDEIGDYRIVELIGEGGFGQVFRADQLRPVERPVALKILKVGMDTAQFVERFRAEQQSLATMDHPNIAKVFDAGATEKGTPYFVMEFVDGAPISQFCDQEMLGIKERLRVFIDVCRGVQHAHQKGVIHRDLKPANVLVAEHDGRPVPQVIDFGIAKAIGSAPSDSTMIHGPLLTPSYMSPEQGLEGGAEVDTRSDVYSLGVILYELLSGKSPYSGKDAIRTQMEKESLPWPSGRVKKTTAEDLTEIAQRRKLEPRRLERIIKGDLDHIVMKALRRDPDERYDGANSLAADLARYLNNEPVQAAKPSVWYRTRKYVRRHPVGVAACAMLLILAVSAVAVGLWTGHQRSLERQTRFSGLENEIDLTPLSNAAGRKGKGLAAVRAAANIRRSMRVRDGAVKILTLLDIKPEPVEDWEEPGRLDQIHFGEQLTRYAIWDAGGTVSIRESGTGELLLELPERFRDVGRLELRDAGDVLAIWVDGGDGGRLSVWDLSGGHMVFPEQAVGGNPDALDISSDGRWIAYGIGEGAIEVQDLQNPGSPVRYEPERGRAVGRLRFQPDGHLLAVGSSKSLYLTFLNLRTAEESRVFFPALLRDFAWHPAGNLVCVAPANSPLYLCGQELDGSFRDAWSFGPTTVGVERVAFSGDGSFLLTAEVEGGMKLRNSTTGEELVTLVMPAGEEVEDLRLSPDDRRVAWSRDGSQVRIWGIETQNIVRTLSSEVSVARRPMKVRFDGSGRVLFVTSERGGSLWDWRNRRFAGVVELGAIDSVEWNPSSDELVIAGDRGGMRVDFFWEGQELNSGTLRLFDAPTLPAKLSFGGGPGQELVAFEVGGEIRCFKGDAFRHHAYLPVGADSGIVAMAVHPRELQIAVLDDQRLKIYAVAGGRGAERVEIGAGDLLAEAEVQDGESVCFSPVGGKLIVGTAHEFRVYERTGSRLEIGKKFPTLLQRGEATVAVDSDGRFAAWNESRSQVAIVDLAAMQVVGHIPLSNNEPPTSLAFSHSGRELAIANGDLRVDVWDLAALNEQLAEFGLDWDDRGRGARAGVPEFTWAGRGNIFEGAKRSSFEEHEIKLADRNSEDGLTPDDLHVRGRAFRDLSEYAKAEAAFSEALRIYEEQGNTDPKWRLPVLDKRADCYRRQDMAQEAVADWEVILEQEPDHVGATLGLAGMYLLGPEETRDPAKGRKICTFFEKDIDDLGFHYFSFFFRAAADYGEGKVAEALDKVELAIEYGHEKNRQAETTRFLMCGPHYLKAMCLYRNGDRFGAERFFAEGTRRWEKDPVRQARHAMYVALRREARELLGPAIGEPDSHEAD